MNYSDAKEILQELYKDKPNLITTFREVPGCEVTTCSYGTNNLFWFKSENGRYGWDVMINKKYLEYRMYVLDIRLKSVKVPGTKHIMLSKIEGVELKTFLREQLRLANKARR